MNEIPDLSRLLSYNEIAQRLDELAELEETPEMGVHVEGLGRTVRQLASEEREIVILEYLIRLDQRLAWIESKISGGKTDA